MQMIQFHIILIKVSVLNREPFAQGENDATLSHGTIITDNSLIIKVYRSPQKPNYIIQGEIT